MTTTKGFSNAISERGTCRIYTPRLFAAYDAYNPVRTSPPGPLFNHFCEIVPRMVWAGRDQAIVDARTIRFLNLLNQTIISKNPVLKVKKLRLAVNRFLRLHNDPELELKLLFNYEPDKAHRIKAMTGMITMYSYDLANICNGKDYFKFDLRPFINKEALADPIPKPASSYTNLCSEVFLPESF